MTEEFEKAIRRLVESSQREGRLLSRPEPKRPWDPMLDLVAPAMGVIIAMALFGALVTVCGG